MEPNEDTRPSFVPQIRERLAQTLAEADQRLDEILDAYDAAELFAVTVISNMFYDPETFSEAEVGTSLTQAERLAYEAYPRFTTTREPGAARVTFSAALACDDAVKDLVQTGALAGLFDRPEKPDDLDMLLAQVRNRAEVVRGTAYPPQTERRIRDVQGRFDAWFEKNTGIAPSRACDVINAIVEGHTRHMNESVSPVLHQRLEESKAVWAEMKRKRAEDREPVEAWILEQARNPDQMRKFTYDRVYGPTVLEHVPVDPSRGDEPAITPDEWKALASLIGMTPEHRDEMERPLDVRHRPLYVLPDDRALVADLSTTLEALWDAYERAARSNQKFYQRYQTLLGKWLEGRTEETLARLFPGANVYSTLDYPDVDKGGNATTELDGAVLWGPFLVLIEAKAKQFRLAGQIDDPGRLRTDLQRNVADAFEQALRARRYVESVDTPTFTERGTGRELVIDKESVRRTYLVTVSAYELGTLTTQLARLAPLGLFGNAESFPFAVSEGDLDVITELLPGPEAFLHYLEQRTALHAAPVRATADEIDLLGAYLETRLVDDLNFDAIDADGVAFSGFNDDVDRWVRWKWGSDIAEPDVRLKLPDGIAVVLEALREGTDEERWVAFQVLGLPRPTLSALAEGLRLAREDPADRGQSRVFMSHGPETTIIVIASNRGEPADTLRQRLRHRVRVERYRRRSPSALGFGIQVASDVAVDVAVWEEGEWTEDPKMEALFSDEKLPTPLPGSRIPGRNDPCFCGSGNKFKRCCGPKLGRAR